jgi:hypothetical protein
MSNRSSAINHDFVALLPRISLHARIYFRHLMSADDKEEASAETIALAWLWFVRLVQRGEQPGTFISAIARYAARAVRSGRRLCGQQTAKDVLSTRVQDRRGFTVGPISDGRSRNDDFFYEALADNTITPVPDQVSFRLDFPAWLSTRATRDRKIIRKLMSGEGTVLLARRFGMSEGRISQLRREYLNDWRTFCDESII